MWSLEARKRAGVGEAGTGNGGLRQVGGTFVLHLFYDFAVSIFDLLRVGDIHLQHREALGAGSSQFLCSRALFIQNPGKYREAQIVQMLGQAMAEPRVTTCKGPKQDSMSTNQSGRRNDSTRKESLTCCCSWTARLSEEWRSRGVC